MRFLLLLAFAATFAATTSAQSFVQAPDSCQPNTFLNVYGDTIKQDGIAALCLAPDGNIYVAGQKANGYAIGKMTPYGNMLWLRNFTSAVQERIFITEIIVDSEGMIAGCGWRHSATGNSTTVFRYNPADNQMLWERWLDINNSAPGGIIEKSPGGNYLVYHSPALPPLSFKSAEILELDRTTGQIEPAFAKRYMQQASQAFAGMVLHDDALYATGYTDSLISVTSTVRRMILAKLDANTGEVLWSRTGLTPWSQTSYFSGVDLIVDDSSLITLSHGIETSNTIVGIGKMVPVYLVKTTLDGQVLWAHKYLFSEMPREVVAVPDGYVILCGWSKRHMLRTNKAGNLLFAKVLDTPGYFSTNAEDWLKNQIAPLGSYLYFTDFTARSNAIGLYTTIWKTDMNLDMEFDCGLIPFALQDSSMANPTLFASQQVLTPSPATAQPAFLTNAPGAITVHLACPTCSSPPCTDKPDIAFQLESIGCDSAAFVTYRLCNSGEQPFSGILNVGVYDANPLLQAANLLDFFELAIANLPPDSCQTGTLDNLFYWGPYTKVYTLAGIESGLVPPIDPAGFPYNGIAECDYANNLDSLDFQYPPAPPKPDLGPDRILCAGDTISLDAGTGFVSYSWSNGLNMQVVPVSATGLYTMKATDACGRIQSDTVAVTVLPQPAPTLLNIEFYPGDTITIGGQPYTQSDTVTLTLSTDAGCDSVVTYFLHRVVTNVDLVCPADLQVVIQAGQSSVSVSYSLPAAATDCPDAGIVLTQLQGPPPGGAFAPGITQVCYEAANHCGIRDTCCFTVTAQQAAEEEACDVKMPPGSCFRFELLGIRLDAEGNPIYRMRLTNTCASPVKFAWFQLPDGITATAPANGAVYTAPSGNSYDVRNPQSGPFHSIRFKLLAGGLNNGASDIFEYTLPKQSQPLYILAAAKLEDGTTAEAHLNTFNCPVQPYTGPVAQNRAGAPAAAEVLLQPNPTSGILQVRLQNAPGETAYFSVLNVQGQAVLEGHYAISNGTVYLRLPDKLANGLYYLRVQLAEGGSLSARFVVQR